MFGRGKVPIRQTLLHAEFGRQSAAAAPRRGLNAGGNHVEIYRARRAIHEKPGPAQDFFADAYLAEADCLSLRSGTAGVTSMENCDHLFLYDVRSQNRARSV